MLLIHFFHKLKGFSMKNTFKLTLLAIFMSLFLVSEAFSLQPPSQQAKYIGFSQIASTTATINVGLPGNGEGRIIVVTDNAVNTNFTAADAAIAAFTSNYTGNAVFGSGTEIATDYFVVSAGTANSVPVTGLTPGHTYNVKVYEYEIEGTTYAYLTDASTLNPRTFTTTSLEVPTGMAETVTGDGANILWHLDNAADGYYLDVRVANGAIIETYDLLNIGFPGTYPGNASYTITGLDINPPGPDYEWRVRPYDGGAVGAACDWQAFTLTDATPPTVLSITLRLQGGADIATFTDGTPDVIVPGWINLDHVGETLELVIEFSEEMDTDFNPEIAFTGSTGDAIGATLSTVFGYWSGTSPNNDTYIIEYTVTDDNVEGEDFDVDFINAAPRDRAGNLLVDLITTYDDLFHVDHIAPVIDTYALTSADGICLSNADGDEFEYTVNITDEIGIASVVAGPDADDDDLDADWTETDAAPQFTINYTVSATDGDVAVAAYVTATDNAGNETTFEVGGDTGTDFTIDNTDPVVRNLTVTSGECTDGANLTEVDIRFEVVDGGCGTWDNSVVTTHTTTANVGTVAIDALVNGSGTDLDPYVFTGTITLDGTDADGDYNVTIGVTDPAGNTEDVLTETGIFSVDGTPPVITLGSFTQTCNGGAGFTRFTLNVVEEGCGDFDETNLTVATDLAGHTPTFVSKNSGVGSVGDPIILTYQIDFTGSEASGNYDISVTAAADAAGNDAVGLPLAFDGNIPDAAGDDEYSIDNAAPVINDVDAGVDVCFADGETISVDVDATDAGCADFDEDNITVKLTKTGSTDIPLTYASKSGDVYTFEYTISGDDNGTWTVSVSATDGKSNGPTTNTSETVNIDTEAPTVSDITASETCISGLETETVRFDFTASDNEICAAFGSGQLGVALQSGPAALTGTLNGVSMDGIVTDGYYFTYVSDGNETDGLYTLRVTGTDEAGNETTKDVSFSIDNTLPVIGAVESVPATVCANEADVIKFYFDITETGCGDVDLADIDADIYTDTPSEHATNLTVADATADLSNPGTYAYMVTYTVGNATADPTDGYQLRLNFTDDAGNDAAQVTYDFNIDNDKPVLAAVSVVDDTDMSDDNNAACVKTDDIVTFTFTATDLGCGSIDIANFTRNWSDPDGTVASLENTPSVITNPSGDTYTFTYLIDADDEAGLYSVVVDVTDGAGNASTSSITMSFRVDRTSPGVNPPVVVSSPTCLNEGQIVVFYVEASDNQSFCDFDEDNIEIGIASNLTDIAGTVVSYGLTAPEGYESSEGPNRYFYSYTVLADNAVPTPEQDGSYEITATVTDDAGNTNVAARAAAFSIDNTAATVSDYDLTSPATSPDCLTTGDLIEFTFIATDSYTCGAPFGTSNIDVFIETDGTETQLDASTITATGAMNTYQVSYTIASTVADGTYDIIVRTEDNATNTSEDIYTSQFAVDNTGPAFTAMTATPSCASFEAGEDVVIEVAVTDPGCAAFGIANLSIVIKNSLGNDVTADFADPTTILLEEAGSLDFRFTIDNASLENILTDTYSVEVTGVDGNGNSTTYTGGGTPVTFSVDNDGAEVSEFERTDSEGSCVTYTDNDRIEVTLTVTNPGCGSLAIPVVTFVDDNSDTQTFTKFDGPASGAGTYTYFYNITSGDYEGGPYDIMVSATDSKNNVATGTTMIADAFSIDFSYPTVTADDNEDCNGPEDVVTFTFTVQDDYICPSATAPAFTVTPEVGTTLAGTISSVSATGNANEYTFTYTVAATGETSGDKTLIIKATDAAGNWDEEDVVFEVDAAAPVISNVSDLSANCYSYRGGEVDDPASPETVTITFNATDAYSCSSFDASDITVVITDPDDDVVSSGNPTGSYTYSDVVEEEWMSGTYTVTITATDDAGNTDTETTTFTVDNTAPEVTDLSVFSEDVCIQPGSVVRFTFEVTNDECGTFPGNGVTPISQLDISSSVETGSGGAANWVSTINGVYRFDFVIPGDASEASHNLVVTIWDSEGNSREQTFADQFTVDNSDPVISSINVTQGSCASDQGTSQNEVAFTIRVTENGCGDMGIPNITDITSTSAATPVVTGVTETSPGVWDFTCTLEITNTDVTGAKDIFVEVTDNAGNEATRTFTSAFTVDATAPTVTPTAFAQSCYTANQTVNIDFTAVDNIDGCGTFNEDNITVTVTDPLSAVVVNAQNPEPNGSDYRYEYELTSALSGTYNVSIVATDDAGNSVTQTTSFTVDNDAPLNGAVTAVTSPTCVASGSTVEFTVVVTENGCGTFNRDDITVTVTDEGSGSVTATTTDLTEVSGTHTFTYTATLTDFVTGAVAVNVVSTDDQLNSDTDNYAAVFTVDATAPVLSALSDPGTCFNGTDVITYTFDFTNVGCNTTFTPTATVYNESSDVIETITNINLVIDDLNTMTFTVANPGVTGNYTVEVTSQDGLANTSNTLTGSFSIDVTAPSITNFDASGCYTDSDVINYSFNASDDGCGTFSPSSFVITTTPAITGLNPTVNDDGGGAMYGELDLSNAATGTYTVNVVATDSKGNSQTYTYTNEFSVDNDAPVVSSVVATPTCVADGDEVTLAITATDAGCADFDGTAMEVSVLGQTATYSSTTGNVYYYTFTVPTSTSNGSYMVQVNAADGNGNGAINNFTSVVTVDNSAPTFGAFTVTPPFGTVAENDVVTISLNIADTGCNGTVAATPSITFTGSNSLNNIASGPTVSGNTYTWTYTVAASDVDGTYGVSILAADGLGNSATFTDTEVFEILQSSAPSVTGILWTTPTVAGFYNAGDVLEFNVTYDEAVDVTGTPTLGTNVGTFSYVSGTGTAVLTFRYTVATGNLQNDVNLNVSSINLNGGTIVADDDAQAADLVVAGSLLAGRHVDAVLPVIAFVTPANSYFNTVTDAITFTLTETNRSLTEARIGSGSWEEVDSDDNNSFNVSELSDWAGLAAEVDFTVELRHTDLATNASSTVSRIFKKDTDEPAVLSLTGNTSTPTTLTVVFEESVVGGTTASNYTFTGSYGLTGNPSSVSGSGTTYELTVADYSSIAMNETIIVTVLGVTDAAGNAVSPNSATWTYLGSVADEVAIINTPNASTGVVTGTSFTFDVQTQTGGSAAYVAANTTVTLAYSGPGSATITPSTLTFTPSVHTQTVTVTVTAAGGATGNSLATTSSLTDDTWNFTVLAAEPTLQASGINLTLMGAQTMGFDWVRGNGAGCLLIGKQGRNLTPVATDGSEPATASVVWGSGSPVDGGYAITKGTTNSAELTNLTTRTWYSFKVFEYNGSGSTINYNTNNATANPYSNRTTNKESVGNDVIGYALTVSNPYPTPAVSEFSFDMILNDSRAITVKLYDMKGSVVLVPVSNVLYSEGEHKFNVQLADANLAAGTYTMTIEAGDELLMIPVSIIK